MYVQLWQFGDQNALRASQCTYGLLPREFTRGYSLSLSLTSINVSTLIWVRILSRAQLEVYNFPFVKSLHHCHHSLASHNATATCRIQESLILLSQNGGQLAT